MKFPDTGISHDEIFERLAEFRSGDLDWRSGRTFGYLFDPGDEIRRVGEEAFLSYLTENGLDFTVYPSLLRLENELVSMIRTHLNGDEDVVGNFTSGGTESIILAIKTARDRARALNPDLGRPEMIVPITAHGAFHKAAHYLDIELVPAPVSPDSFRMDVDAVAGLISPNTILLVGSAPSYSHGVVDGIEELGQLALKHDLLLHVDACIGGFMLPFFRRLGVPVPDFDFSVPGVTSISIDLHKYAYAPKGASMVLYRDRHLRKYQIFACARWTGYTLLNNTIQSSKSGGPMAAAWAVMHFIGDAGYLDIARRQLEAMRAVIEAIERNEHLRLMTEPDLCLIAFTSDTVNVFNIVDEMHRRGWYIQPAHAFGGSKEHIHITINASNVPQIAAFIRDLEESVEAMREAEPATLVAEFLAQFEGLDPTALTDDRVTELLAGVGVAPGTLPDRMADLNEILNHLPAEIRERLLIEFVNGAFIPSSDPSTHSRSSPTSREVRPCG